mmetsp:Transcript_11233/g.24170  ORF Transcript_11233/g.24170 Transcript_11233/m.24170 type:complete len:316 (+) Transcript_11233:313-1260(+)
MHHGPQQWLVKLPARRFLFDDRAWAKQLPVETIRPEAVSFRVDDVFEPVVLIGTHSVECETSRAAFAPDRNVKHVGMNLRQMHQPTSAYRVAVQIGFGFVAEQHTRPVSSTEHSAWLFLHPRHVIRRVRPHFVVPRRVPTASLEIAFPHRERNVIAEVTRHNRERRTRLHKTSASVRVVRRRGLHTIVDRYQEFRVVDSFLLRHFREQPNHLVNSRPVKVLGCRNHFVRVKHEHLPAHNLEQDALRAFVCALWSHSVALSVQDRKERVARNSFFERVQVRQSQSPVRFLHLVCRKLFHTAAHHQMLNSAIHRVCE